MRWTDYRCVKCMHREIWKSKINKIQLEMNEVVKVTAVGEVIEIGKRGKCDGHCIKCGMHFDDPRDDVIGETQSATKEEVQKVINHFKPHDLDAKAYGISGPDGQTMIDKKKSLLDT